MFFFTREVKSLALFSGWGARNTWAAVRSAALAIQDDFWQSQFSIHEPDAERDFFACWRKVRTKVGDASIEHAVRQAGERWIEFRSDLEADHEDDYFLFVETCYWLQADAPRGRILIPVRGFARAMRIRPSDVVEYRRIAQAHGFLTLIEKHPAKSRKADEFQFNMEMVKLRKDGP